MFIGLDQRGMVVGYQQNTADGQRMVTPTFVNVDGSEFDINNLIVVGVEDTMADMQVMNAEGKWAGHYFWYNEATYDGVTYPAGWFDFAGENQAEFTLKPGEAVFFNTSVSGAKVQTAGAVPGEITTPVPVGYSMIGNGSPVAVDINDITIDGAADTMVDIQIISTEGKFIGHYYWYNEATYDGVTYPAGWFDFAGENQAEVTLQPGDAALFNTSVANVKAKVPSAMN